MDGGFDGEPQIAENVSTQSLQSLGIQHIDGITAGLPCPAFSVAGKQLGSKDSRNLFPDFFRIVRDVQPRWAIVENFPGLLTTESGSFFASVLRDFSECGYDVCWSLVSAASVGAVHRRYRLWIVAYSSGEGQRQRQGTKIADVNNFTAYPNCWEQRELHIRNTDSQEWTNPAPVGCTFGNGDRCEQQSLSDEHESRSQPEPTLRISHDGLPFDMDGYLLRQQNLEQWLVAATIPKFSRLSAEEVRNLTREEQAEYRELWEKYQAIRRQHKEQLKALGNAIVPQCAAVIFDKLKVRLKP